MLVQVNGVQKTFPMSRGPVTALADITLDLPEGKLVAICGPSGSGKTTLLLTLGGMLRPDSGSVTVCGQQLYSLSRRERAHFRAAKIGFVFQMFHLVPYLTVRENILLPMDQKSGQASQRAEACDQMIARLGLEHRAHHKPAQLSAGERQRTAIARATLLRPPLLLADEPTGNLDQQTAGEVYRLLSEYRNEGGTVVVVTHAPDAMSDADQVLKMAEGRFVPPAPTGA